MILSRGAAAFGKYEIISGDNWRLGACFVHAIFLRGYALNYFENMLSYIKSCPSGGMADAGDLKSPDHYGRVGSIPTSGILYALQYLARLFCFL